MKAVLICPDHRPKVSPLAVGAPLACMPALGETLLEYWLSFLSSSGVNEVVVLSSDRTEQVVKVVGDGARWGIKVNVLSESRELTPAQVLLKYAVEFKDVEAQHVIVVDHFPGLPEISLFASYADWFAGLQAWMASAITPDRVGVHQAQPGVWLGANSHVSSRARLLPPCWIGQRVVVGARATIGPCAIIEDGSLIEPGADIRDSQVAPFTFVGRGAQIERSIAVGNVLINWKTCSFATVPDPFLLCALRHTQPVRRINWFGRLVQLCASEKEEVEVALKDALVNKES